MPRPYCRLFLPGGFHQSPEEAEEHKGGDRGGEDVCHGLRQEHGEGLVPEEIRQQEDQGDQQDDLAQQRHDQADLRLSQSHESLLAADLEAHGKAADQKHPDRPGRVIHQGGIVGEDPGEEAGEAHHDRPEHRGIGHADAELAEECLLHPVELLRAVVVADQGLAALADAGEGHGDELVDGGQHRHRAHRHIAAKPRQGGGEADGQDALGGDHHKAGDAQSQTGEDHPGDQPQILPPQLQDGLPAGEKPQDPHRAHRLAQDGGDGRAPDAQIQTEHQNGIEDDVDDRADHRGQHADLREALGGDEGVHAHDHQDEEAAQNVDPGIFQGIGQGGIRRAEPAQQRGAGGIEHAGEHRRQDQQHTKAVAQNLLRLFPVALTHGDGRPGRTAGARQQGKGRQQHQNRRK